MLDIGNAAFLRAWLFFFQEGVLNFFTAGIIDRQISGIPWRLVLKLC